MSEIEKISPDEIETRTDLSDSDRARLRTLLKKMDSARSERWRKEPQKIVFLTSPDSQETLVLPNEIPNDRTSKRGKKPFARPHSYVSLSSLEKAQYISDLEDI